MKKLILFIFLSALLVAFPRSAQAYYDENTTLPATVVAPLMAWVEVQTGIHVPVLPKVFASRGMLRRIAAHSTIRARGTPGALFFGGMVVVDHHLFDERDGTQLSLLVHELVHYAQSFTPHARWSCERSKEEQAYTLQNKWLEERGHYPIVRASWIQRMASCPVQTVAMAQ